MLKIVGGKHRGRAIATPEGEKTRPTSSRAREALFNILIHANWSDDGTSPLIDARVLDAFAGSGALGLEALSRGAAHATFLDSDPTAIKLIGENLRKLGETATAKVIRADVTHPPPSQRACDLAFLDPPYRSGLAAPALTALAEAGLAEARRHRHRRTRQRRGADHATAIRGDRREALWCGQDRDPAPHSMKLTAPLYMLRHGETAWNTERRMQGTKNSALTERGRAQAIAMGRALKAELAREPGPDRLPAQPARPHPRDSADRRPRARPRSPANGATIPGSPNSPTASGKASPGRRSRPAIPMRSANGGPIRTASARRAARPISSFGAAAKRPWPTSSPPISAPSW